MRRKANIGVLLALSLMAGVLRPTGDLAAKDNSTKTVIAEVGEEPTESLRPFVDPEVTADPPSTADPSATVDPAAIPTIDPQLVLPPEQYDPSIVVDIEACSMSAVNLSLGPANKHKLVVSGFVSGGAVTLRWSSSDTHVATVSSDGEVRGENAGKAVITARLCREGQVVREMHCQVTVTVKKVSYSKIRKKLRKKKTPSFIFSDRSGSESDLTLFGFYYRAYKLYPHNYTYGSGDETIILYPMIIAKKDGDSSSISLGIKLSSFVEIHSVVSRSYKTMILSGGGEKIKLSGKTTCKKKTIGSFIRWQIKTNGVFRLSETKNTHLGRLDKLKRILSCKKPKITVKDTCDHRTYKCIIGENGSKELKTVIKKYRKLLKAY